MSARPRSIWLHIGLHKTASTFVQYTLESNTEALATQGFLYPQAGRLGAGHALLAFPFLAPERAAEPDVAPFLGQAQGAWTALQREAAESDCRRLVLSSEYFSLVKDLAPVRAACEALGGRTRVVVYLRRQDRLLEAGYNQGIKAGIGTRRLVLGETLPHSLDWYRLVSRWAEHFGKENVIVRVFEEARAGGGILEDFCAAVGLDETQLVAAEQRNLRLCNEVLGYRRLENLLGFSDSRLAHQVSERMRASGYPDRPVLAQGERVRVVEAFEASNRRVAREFLGRADGRLFDRNGLSGPDEVASELDGIGAALAVAWDALTAELAELRAQVQSLREEVERGRPKPPRRRWRLFRR